MSDAPDRQEKTFDPSPRRLRKAREEGNVLRARDVVSVGMLTAGLAGLAVSTPAAFEALRLLTGEFFAEASTAPVSAEAVPALMTRVGVRLLLATAPLFAGLMVAAVAFNAVQSGVHLAPKALQPKGNRISPLQGFKRLFSAKGLFDGLKALAKIAVVGPLAYVIMRDLMPELVRLHTMPLEAVGHVAFEAARRLALPLLGALALVAGLDYGFERWRWRGDLKMTAKEVKDETKEDEGDPHVKGRRRQMARQWLKRPPLEQALARADVVVTNPTHYAVALRYDPLEAPAPRVLAKGIRKRALRIKAMAAEMGVPLLENRPLARALFAGVEEDQQIPEELFPAVAAVLAEVYRRRRAA